MYNSPLILCMCLVILSVTGLHAQNDLRNDTPFFEEQAVNYQKWLDHTGLGSVLHVRELDVQEKELALYLEFPYSDIDSIVNAWQQLKAAFEAQSPLTLEQQLFYKANQLMEVRQSALSVQLYDTYDLRREPLFMRAIYFDGNTVATEASNPKSKIKDIIIRARVGANGQTPTVEAFKQSYSREKVYDCIYTYATNTFEQRNCDGRLPEIHLLEDQEVLRFEVVDLCKVVLTDEENPRICDWLDSFGYDCNWIKRELLTFTYTYEPIVDGFRLNLIIDGKVGSGLYRTVRRGGYLSMEVDFDDYLERYADQTAVEIRRMLENCQ